MTKVQLTLFDPIIAEKYQKTQEQAELDAFVLRVLGPRAFKRRKQKDAELTAALAEARKTPLRPDMLEALEKVRQKIIASTKPFMAEEFSLLGLEREASKRDVKNAYRRQARKLHPDKGGDEASMKRLNAAYKRLLEVTK